MQHVYVQLYKTSRLGVTPGLVCSFVLKSCEIMKKLLIAGFALLFFCLRDVGKKRKPLLLHSHVWTLSNQIFQFWTMLKRIRLLPRPCWCRSQKMERNRFRPLPIKAISFYLDHPAKTTCQDELKTFISENGLEETLKKLRSWREGWDHPRSTPN